MEHRQDIHAYGNDGEGRNDAVCESSNKFKNMAKKDMIDVIKKKNSGENLANLAPYVVIVNEAKFYDYRPDKFVVDVLKQNGEDEYFFLTQRKPMSPGSIIACRTADGGNWKQNGARNEIKDDDGKLIGYERFFEYQRGDKTSWRLYEYEEVQEKDQNDNLLLLDRINKMKNDYVMCKLYKISEGASHNNGERKIGKRKSSQNEEKRAAKCLRHEYFLHNLATGASSSTAVPQSVSKFPAIEDFLHNPAAGVIGNMLQSAFPQAGNPAGCSGGPAAQLEDEPTAQLEDTQPGNPTGEPAALHEFMAQLEDMLLADEPTAQLEDTQAGTGEPAALLEFMAQLGDMLADEPTAQLEDTQAGTDEPTAQLEDTQAGTDEPTAQLEDTQAGNPSDDLLLDKYDWIYNMPLDEVDDVSDYFSNDQLP